MRFNLSCLLMFATLVGISLPVQAQVLQPFPSGSPTLSPDRSPSPSPQPFPSQQSQTVSKVCNPTGQLLRQYIGFPNDTTVPPRVALFTIPLNTCVELLSDGRFFSSRLDQGVGNRNIFDFCNRVRLQDRDRFGNPRSVSCERNDLNQLDQVRIRSRRNIQGTFDIFDIFRGGRRGLDDGSFENQPR